MRGQGLYSGLELPESVDRIEGGGDHESACVPKPLRTVAADQEGGSTLNS